MTWLKGSGSGGGVSGDPDGYVGVADGETEFKAGQILLSKANGEYYDVDTAAVVAEPAGHADCSIRVASERLVVGFSIASATSPTMKIVTSNTQPYEIDWGEGDGYESAASNTVITKNYGSSHSGTVYVRFAPNQYPIDFEPTGSAWNFKPEELNELNKFNTIEKFNTSSTSIYQIDLRSFIAEGSNIDYLYIFSTEKGFGDYEWGQYLNRARKLAYFFIYITSAKIDQGSIDLDVLEFPSTVERIYLNVSGATMSGDIPRLVTSHPDVNYYLILGSKITSSTTVSDDPFIFRSEMDAFYCSLLDTEEKVDAVLEALATRSNPTWIGNKILDIGSSNGIPSATGLAHKAIIEAQPGSPTVLVNS